jgi:Xaa-Pro aminopeptidase
MKKLTGAILFVGAPNQLTDVRYRSGFTAVDPVVYLETGRRGHLIVPPMEVGRAKRQVHHGVEVVSSADLGLSRSERCRLSSWAIALLHRLKIRRVIVGAMFPVAVARRLEKARIRVCVATTSLFPAREIKSAREVRRIAETQAAAAAAMRAAIAVIARSRAGRDGRLTLAGHLLTTEAVERVIDHVLLEHGCVAEETIVACGRPSADPHDRGSGPLRARQPIVVDIFPRNRRHGYWGDITRTIVKGKAPERLGRMYRAVRRAQLAALAKVKEGVRVKAIHGAVQEVFDRGGFRTEVRGGMAEGFTHGTGHGVGLDIHEAPSVGPGEGRLRAGNVITVEPGLYYRSIGGVRIEDTVVVTRKGWKHLAKTPYPFEV